MSITYDVVATRNGDWWEIEVTTGLPDSMLGVSQARRLTEVKDVARTLIADLLALEEPDAINIRLQTDMAVSHRLP